LLRELIPNAAVFGVLANPASPEIQSFIAELQAASQTLGLQLVVVNARTDSDLETVLQLFRNSALVRSWSASVPSTSGARNNSRRWRPAMQLFRRSTGRYCALQRDAEGDLHGSAKTSSRNLRQPSLKTQVVAARDRPVADLPVVKDAAEVSLSPADTLGHPPRHAASMAPSSPRSTPSLPARCASVGGHGCGVRVRW
jgi:hypothetical protein